MALIVFYLLWCNDSIPLCACIVPFVCARRGLLRPSHALLALPPHALVVSAALSREVRVSLVSYPDSAPAIQLLVPLV